MEISLNWREVQASFSSYFYRQNFTLIAWLPERQIYCELIPYLLAWVTQTSHVHSTLWPQCTVGVASFFYGAVYVVGDQRSLYIKCAGLREDLNRDYWQGIKLYNTTVARQNVQGNALNESTSRLEYVDILYAGKKLLAPIGVDFILEIWTQNGPSISSTEIVCINKIQSAMTTGPCLHTTTLQGFLQFF